MAKEIIVDSFAGGGGASLGIAWALGRGPDIAINHDADALDMHAKNHPSTKHVLEDVWKADLRNLVGRRKVGLLWASPDCRHFSRAKGGKPVSKRVRSLAWIVCKWASQVKPRIICLENVREFADWGPTLPMWECRRCGWRGTEGQAVLKRGRRRCSQCDSLRLEQTDAHMPDPKRKGLTFRRFVGRLRNLGYAVQWRNLDAADFGAPTHRRRLFLIARCDGKPIIWPEATHAAPGKVNDMPLFGQLKPWRTAAECIDWSIPCPSIFDRARPLAEKTLRRIALGIKRYVLETSEPFIVPVTHTGERRSHGTSEPLPTITRAQRGELALVSPILTKYHGQKANESRCLPLDQPFNTLDTQNRYAIVAPTLIDCAYGDNGRRGNGAHSLESPIGTIHSGGGNHAVVAAYLAKHFGDVVGVPADTPLPTTTTRGTQTQVVAANLVRFNFDDAGIPLTDPSPTLTTNNHAGLVYSFLVRYFGTAIGQHVTEPLYTITGKDRFGLVTVRVNGEPYVIADIGMRMLTPRELARAQGFPDTYELTGNKGRQVAKIGNSVCPVMAQRIVEANYVQSLASV